MGRKPALHRVNVDLGTKHLKLLGKIRMALGRWGMPASAASSLRMAIEVLDEQLSQKPKPSETSKDAVEPEPGLTSHL